MVSQSFENRPGNYPRHHVTMNSLQNSLPITTGAALGKTGLFFLELARLALRLNKPVFPQIISVSLRKRFLQ
jgi:hypothetical protein